MSKTMNEQFSDEESSSLGNKFTMNINLTSNQENAKFKMVAFLSHYWEKYKKNSHHQGARDKMWKK